MAVIYTLPRPAKVPEGSESSLQGERNSNQVGIARILVLGLGARNGHCTLHATGQQGVSGC